MNKKVVVLLGTLLLPIHGSFAEWQPRKAKVLDHKETTYIHSDCKRTDTCSLKKVRFLVEDTLVLVEGKFHYATRLFAEYETDSIDTLYDYIFVQYIRGCVFQTERDDSSGVQLVRYDGYPGPNELDFKFSKWRVDTYSNDPTYPSVAGRPRHAFYAWNSVDGSFDDKTKTFLVNEEPRKPLLYVTDRVGTAFFMNFIATNRSVQFRMCLYRSKDVPATLSQIEKIGEPLYCHDWDNIYIYDHYAGVFDRLYEMSPVCNVKE